MNKTPPPVPGSLEGEFARIHARLDKQDAMLEKLITHEFRINKLEGHAAAIVKGIGGIVIGVLTLFCAIKLGLKP